MRRPFKIYNNLLSGLLDSESISLAISKASQCIWTIHNDGRPIYKMSIS